MTRPSGEAMAAAASPASDERVDILLIDDNTDYLVLIQRALERHDPRYRVTGVPSPEEAHALLDQRSFQLVLLDYKFPRGNGLQVIRKLKGKSQYVPTVMVTAFGDESLAIQCMREGALDFVPKTADFMQALPEVVARAVERGRIIRERIRAQQHLERRNRELQALIEIASVINATRDPDEILAFAAGSLKDLLGATSCRIRVGPPPEGGSADLQLREQAGRRQLVVPLVSRDEALGSLLFELPPDRELSDSDRALIASVAHQVAMGVEHARLYRALSATEQYLQDLVEHAGDEVVTIDLNGRIITWNAGAAETYGWSRSEAVGRHWSLLWPEDRRSLSDELAWRVTGRNETLRNFETTRLTRDGTHVDILLTLSPLTSPEGIHRGVACIGKNVTYRKQLQAQLVQSEKMAAVGQLISGVAHELNNPLTAVLGYAQLVAGADVGAKLPTYLERIASEASRCQRIVANLLTFARKHEPKATRVDLNSVVRRAVELREYDLRVQNVTLVHDLETELPTTLADQNQIQQVLINLITNAHHAATKDKPVGRIVVRTSLEERGPGGRPAIVVTVEDDGPGVPPALRERVFDPFFTTKEPGEGTGLGLSISYGIVQQHGGDIVVGDSESGGARFDVRLPVLPDLSQVEAPEAVLSSRPDRPARSRRILVVDDQPSVREIFAEILGRDGHQIDMAGGGREALSRIKDGGRYDLLIVDLRMPDLDGHQLYEEVRTSHPELAGRMVFASGDIISDEDRVTLEREGNRFLAKPFGVDDVRSAVSSFFEERS